MAKMNTPDLKLDHPPIVEAVVDVDCDMPSGFDLATMQGAAHASFGAQYPKLRPQFLEQHHFEAKPDQTAVHSARRAVQSLQFLQDDEKQLVQVRSQGYSFNRLKPYTSLDDYLPEIRRTWDLFVGIASPVQVRVIRLRYINRIPLPFEAGRVELNDYLKIGPRLPDENKLQLVGFFNQHTAMERESGHQVTTVLASQLPENKQLPIIFDNCVASAGTLFTTDWDSIHRMILSLRDLKNRIFRDTLTEPCLSLFRT
jgi:uncharacterized protein (TIGR04255 family)